MIVTVQVPRGPKKEKREELLPLRKEMCNVSLYPGCWVPLGEAWESKQLNKAELPAYPLTRNVRELEEKSARQEGQMAEEHCNANYRGASVVRG